MKNKKLLIGLAIIIVMSLVSGLLIWKGKSYLTTLPQVSIVTDETDYEAGGILKVNIKNNSLENLCLSSCYPYYLEIKEKNWQTYNYDKCEEGLAEKCMGRGEVKAFQLPLLQIEGLHRMAVPICINCQAQQEFKEEKRFYSNQFTIKGEKKEPKETTITTDKTEYEPGETVKMTVRNNLAHQVCVADCGAYYFEKKSNGGWTALSWPVCASYNVGKCVVSKGAITFEQDLKVLGDTPSPEGTYRAVFPICIDCEIPGDFRKDEVSYSNEFTISGKEVTSTEEKVIIITNKTGYKQGETVKVYVKNNSNESIFALLSPTISGYFDMALEKKSMEGKWTKIYAAPPPPPSMAELDDYQRINPEDSYWATWDQKIFSDKIEVVGDGIFRVKFGYITQLKASQLGYPNKKGIYPKESDFLVVYSNEFRIQSIETTVPDVPEAVYKCSKDNDCISVKDWCCGCSGGGSNTAINKNYLDYWNKKLLDECNVLCITMISDHWTCSAQPKCLNGKCQLSK